MTDRIVVRYGRLTAEITRNGRVVFSGLWRRRTVAALVQYLRDHPTTPKGA